MNCFVLNETDGRQVLQLADDFESTAQIKTVYFYWNICFSFTCMTLNALLCIVIIRNPNTLIIIRPMLLANSIIDFLFAGAFFFSGRYLFVGYHYAFTTYMGFIKIADSMLLYFTEYVQFFMGVASWNMVVAQFVYRLLVVKYNEQLHGRRLVCFVTCFIVFIFLHSVTVVGGNSQELLHEDLNEVTRLLQYYGFEAQSSVFGRIPNQYNIFNCLHPLLTLLGLLLIIYSAIKIRRILRQSTVIISATTRKLNQSMDRTLFAMSIGPIILNIVVTLTFRFLINRCQSNAIFSLLLMNTFLCATILNTICTLTFIRFYRRGFLRLISFGFYKKSMEVKNISPKNNK